MKTRSWPSVREAATLAGKTFREETSGVMKQNMQTLYHPFTFDDIEIARRRIEPLVLRSPVVHLQDGSTRDIRLKLENLQPVGSFKIRGAANALLQRRHKVKEFYTASAGNFAQGLAYAGRALGLPVKAYVPETAGHAKIEAIRMLGAQIETIPYTEWWKMLRDPPEDPMFIHPFADRDVIAGNATIGLELQEGVPGLSTVLVPYGGGGLASGIAIGLRAAGSQAHVIACESEAGAPLTAAFSAGGPVDIDFDSETFINGMGGPGVLPQMWPLVKDLISDTAVVSLQETADAVRLLFQRHHVIAEGAGAVPVAAALAGTFSGPVACIVSGGHLDQRHLISILAGGTP